MKKIVFPVIAVLMFGCDEPNVKSKTTPYTIPRGRGNSGMVSEVRIVEIEGCEYFLCTNGNGNLITHKGNCKNPIHYKK